MDPASQLARLVHDGPSWSADCDIYTNIQIQIHKYNYTNTNTQIQIHKYNHHQPRGGWQQSATIPTPSSSSSSSSCWPPTQVPNPFAWCTCKEGGAALTTRNQLMALSKSAGATINHQLPILLLPPQGMLHCFAVCLSMQQQQQQHYYAPANNPTCSTTLAPAGCCWQGLS